MSLLNQVQCVKVRQVCTHACFGRSLFAAVSRDQGQWFRLFSSPLLRGVPMKKVPTFSFMPRGPKCADVCPNGRWSRASLRGLCGKAPQVTVSLRSPSFGLLKLWHRLFGTRLSHPNPCSHADYWLLLMQIIDPSNSLSVTSDLRTYMTFDDVMTSQY